MLDLGFNNDDLSSYVFRSSLNSSGFSKIIDSNSRVFDDLINTMSCLSDELLLDIRTSLEDSLCYYVEKINSKNVFFQFPFGEWDKELS